MTEPVRLLALLGPVTIATVVSSVAARWLVRRSPLAHIMVAIAVVACSVTVVDMVVLNHFMLLDPGNWAEIVLVALYSLTAAVAAAMLVGRSTGDAIRRLSATAQALGNNELDARTGPLRASPELQLLAATLDLAAERLALAIETERRIEGQRRDLMSSISHDLRTPLASIRATVEAINDGVVDDPDTVRRYAAEMLTSITTLVEMVEDLFELSQLDVRSFADDSRRLPLTEAIRRAAELSGHDATLRDVRIDVSVAAPAEAMCSPKLVRVVHSLIDNAVRYTPRGGSVVVRATAEAGGLRVTVEDTGQGIAPEQLHRVFEPFWRADEARSTKGSGLGLALAQRIVEALGGRIEATSTPDVGSRFVVSLPL